MKKSLILILILSCCFLMASTVMGILSQYIFMESVSESLRTFVIYSGSFVLTIVGLSIFGKRLNWKRPSPHPRFEKLNLPLLLLAIILIIIVDMVMEPLLSFMPESNLDEMYDMMDGGLWSVLTAVIAAPVLEEFIFRGYVQGNLVRFTNPYIGILVASLIFGAIHIAPQQAILASFIAIIIGVIYYLTNSLMTAIAIHLLNNGLTYTLTMFLGRDVDINEVFQLSDTTYKIVYFSALGFLLIMGYIAVVRIQKRRKLHTVDKGIAESSE